MTTMTRRLTRQAVNNTSVATEGDWRMRAACATEDPELFFPIGVTGPADARVHAAKQVCARCPVMDQCLRWSLQTRQVSGVWGGLDEDERRKMLKRRARTSSPDKTAVDHIVETRLDEFRALQGRSLTAMEIADAMGTNVHTVYEVRAHLDAEAGVTDEEKIEAWLAGEQVIVSREMRLVAIVTGIERGMAYRDIDEVRKESSKDATAQFVGRMRRQYEAAGKAFPKVLVGMPRFTASQVVEIREAFAAGGVTKAELALKYDVVPKSISLIVTGQSHKGAGGPICAPRENRPSMASRVLWGGGQEGFLKTAV